jgi:hypothetical protein
MENPPAEVLPPPRSPAANVLERLVALAAGAARATRIYALVAAVAAAVIAVFLFRDGVPADEGELVARIVVVAAAAVPPILLLLFAAAVKALADLPRRIRGVPREAGERAEELRRLRERATTARGRTGLLRLPLTLWQLVRLGGSSRELLTPYAGVVTLLRLPFLGWTLAAAAAAAVEIVIAAVLLLALLLGS